MRCISAGAGVHCISLLEVNILTHLVRSAVDSSPDQEVQDLIEGIHTLACLSSPIPDMLSIVKLNYFLALTAFSLKRYPRLSEIMT